MRIGCIWDGHDLLGLMWILGQSDHEYHLITDHRIRPSSTKSAATQRMSMQTLLEYARTLGCDAVVLPPVYESHGLTIEGLKVIPLFATTVEQYVLPWSIVNKRGILTDDLSSTEDLTTSLNASYEGYTPTENQANNKHYQVKPVLTFHQVPQMKYHQLTYAKREWMIRKAWKYELRTLKDAAIDTVILWDYSLLYREQVLRHHLNWKKIDIIWKSQITKVFEDLCWVKSDAYSITVHTTDAEGFEHTFLSDKKWKWMLERGKSIEVKVKKLKS